MISSIILIFLGKSSNLVIFGSKHGTSYNDNSRFLFEWIHHNRPEIKCIWITRKDEILEMLEINGLSCLNMFSLRGKIALKRATVGVISYSLRDIAPNPIDVPNSIKIIQLFHGQCVKAVRFAIKEGLTDNEIKERRKEAELVSYAISTSGFMSKYWEKCVQFGLNKHVTTGYPRNDCLIRIPKKHSNMWSKYLKAENNEKTILYAPTWRHGREPTKFFPFKDFNKDKLVDFLEQKNTILLLRPHKNDLNKHQEIRLFLEDLANSKRVKLATHTIFDDVNSILPFVDILMTDYSGLYHDYLLMNRPMIFIPYDYGEFESKSGFLYDYYNNLPGPAVDSFEKLQFELENIINGTDNYLKPRKTLRDKIHKYRDSSSCERVADLVKNLLPTIQ